MPSKDKAALRERYSDEELNAVIDSCGLGFMRNYLLKNDSEMEQVINTAAGHSAVVRVRVRNLIKSLAVWIDKRLVKLLKESI